MLTDFKNIKTRHRVMIIVKNAILLSQSRDEIDQYFLDIIKSTYLKKSLNGKIIQSVDSLISFGDIELNGEILGQDRCSVEFEATAYEVMVFDIFKDAVIIAMKGDKISTLVDNKFQINIVENSLYHNIGDKINVMLERVKTKEKSDIKIGTGSLFDPKTNNGNKIMILSYDNDEKEDENILLDTYKEFILSYNKKFDFKKIPQYLVLFGADKAGKFITLNKEPTDLLNVGKYSFETQVKKMPKSMAISIFLRYICNMLMFYNQK